jgi:hypothetical protein
VNNPRHAVEERAQPVERDADVDLVRHARGADRLGVHRAQAPEPRTRRRVVGDHGVIDARDLQRQRKLVQRVNRSGALH